MKTQKLAALLVLFANGAMATDAGCKTNPALTGRCYVVSGDITVDTDSGPNFDRDDPDHRLVIRPAPGSREMMPRNVERAFEGNHANHVHGTYEVCPIPSQTEPEKDRFVCLNSASHLSTGTN